MQRLYQWLANFGLGALRVRGAGGGGVGVGAWRSGPTAEERRAVLREMRVSPIRWGRRGLRGIVTAVAGVGLSAALSMVVGVLLYIDMAWASRRDGSMFGGLFGGGGEHWSLLSLRGVLSWSQWVEEVDRASQLAPASYAVFAMAVVLVLFCVLVLIWCRLGARACLTRRGRCVRCAHDLIGQPIFGTPEQDAVLAVRCSECGAKQAVVRGWGEIRPRVDDGRDDGVAGHAGAARLVYSPASGLVSRLWTRRRVAWAGAVAGALVLIAGAAWGIREWRVRQWIASEVAAAKAVVLTDEQREAIINEGRRVPMVPAGQEDRAAAVRRVAAELGATYLQFADLPDVAGKPVNRYSHGLLLLTTPSDHAKAKADGRAFNADTARQMFAIIRASVLPDAVAGVADRPLPAWLSLAGGSTKECHSVAMAALMLIREAAIRGDLAEVRRQSAAVVAIIELVQDEPSFLHADLAAQLSKDLCRHFDWIARTHPDREWLEAVLDIAASVPQNDLARVLRIEEGFWRDYLAREAMLEPERLHRGILDSLAQGDSHSGRLVLRAPPAVAERVSFQETVGAISGFTEDRIASLQVTPLVKRAEFLEQLRQERPEVYTNGAVWAFLQYWDPRVEAVVRSELRVRALRLSVRMELFRLEHGRLPTEAEFASMFANDPDAQDPYVGGLLRYRVQEETERTADPDARSPRGMPVLKRGYVLYAVGPDGSDNGGTRPLEDWRMRDVEGFDVVLP